jgi:hypothetical protein
MAAAIATTVHAAGAVTTATSSHSAAVSGFIPVTGERPAERLLKIAVRNRKKEELIQWLPATST